MTFLLLHCREFAREVAVFGNFGFQSFATLSAVVHGLVCFSSSHGLTLGTPFCPAELVQELLRDAEAPGDRLVRLGWLRRFYGGSRLALGPLGDDLTGVPRPDFDISEGFSRDLDGLGAWVDGPGPNGPPIRGSHYVLS